jgi:hypothetical protein
MKRIIALILFLILIPFALAGAITNVPYTFANGQYVDANAMNSNFSAICTDTLNIWSAQGASNAWANNGLLAVSNQNLGVSNYLMNGLLAVSNQNLGDSNWLYSGLLAVSNQGLASSNSFALWRSNINSGITVTNGCVGIGSTSPVNKLELIEGGFLIRTLSSNSFQNPWGGNSGLIFVDCSDSFASVFPCLNGTATIGSENTNGLTIYNSAGPIIFAGGWGGVNSIMTVNRTGSVVISGSLTVSGSISKGSGSFDIPHPDPAKEKQGYRLKHYFVESPTAGDNIYRWKVTVKHGDAVIALPGYFAYLNENVQVWVSAVESFGRAYGKVDSSMKQLIVKADTDGDYNVLCIGTRKDKIATDFFNKYGVEYISNNVK